MEVVVQTRFSYLGKSGWKAKESRDPELLFDQHRMNLRFMLFENITLPSLASQTDDNFVLHVLSSDKMPKPYQDRLREVCEATLGKERVQVTFEGYAIAGRYFRNYLWRTFTENDLVAQTVLDDDDAFSADFIARCKVASAKEAQEFDEERNYIILSFPTGYHYNVSQPIGQQFSNHRERWINLGLTWVSNGRTDKNILLTRHKVVNRFHPVATYFGRYPVYIRTAHDVNDTRVGYNLETEEDIVPNRVVLRRFPFLTPTRLKSIKTEAKKLSALVRPSFSEDI